MLKDLRVKPYVFPMPVLMIATYDENDKVDVMNMAWGWYLFSWYGCFKY